MTLPELTLPSWMAGTRLGGEVTLEALVLALYSGCNLSRSSPASVPRTLSPTRPDCSRAFPVRCTRRVSPWSSRSLSCRPRSYTWGRYAMPAVCAGEALEGCAHRRDRWCRA